MYALFKESSHQNFLSHKSNYGKNPVANPDNWVAFDGQHVHYSTNNLEALTDDLIWYFRKTAGAKNSQLVNDRATITAIKGNSVAIENLIPTNKRNFTNLNKTDVRTVFSLQIMCYKGTSTYLSSGGWGGSITQPQYVKVIVPSLASGTNTLRIKHNGQSSDIDFISAGIISVIDTHKYLVAMNVVGSDPSTSGGLIIKNIQLYDLTILYGIGNEPQTVATFEADYFKWFGHGLTYYTVEALEPKICNAKINSLKTIKFNLFDGLLQLKNIDFGGESDAASYLSCVNYIKVFNNVNYRIKAYVGNRNDIQVYCIGYDGYKNIIFRTPQHDNRTQNNEYISCDLNVNNADYIKFFLYSGISWNLNEFINLPNNGIAIYEKTNYIDNIESYEDRTYSIPITSITGKLNGTGNSVVVFPEGMKSAGSVADEIVVEGGVTKAIKRIGSVDLGNLSWKISGNYIVASNLITPATNTYNNICSMYKTVSLAALSSNMDKTLGIGGPNIYARDTAYSNGATFKTAMNGVMCYYELATPQVYILDNFTLPLNIKVWKYGNEQFITNDLYSTGPQLTIHYNVN